MTSGFGFTAEASPARPAQFGTGSRGRSSRPTRDPRSAQAPGLSHARRADRGAQEGRPAQGPQGPPVLETLEAAAMARRYFGTDGIRGIVGEDLTPELVEKIGRAAMLWAGNAAPSDQGSDPGRVLIGRDTRGSRPVLEAALARGISRPAARPSSQGCSRRLRWPSSRKTSAQSYRPPTTHRSTTA